MPAVAMSSVVVVSTARAQRMQRRTCTVATGGCAASMLKPVEDVAGDESESDVVVEEAELYGAELSPAGMMRERRGCVVWEVNSGIWTFL